MGYRWTRSCKHVTGKLTAFTNFYLKDLTWSDDDNMYLGPVVAAQKFVKFSYLLISVFIMYKVFSVYHNLIFRVAS